MVLAGPRHYAFLHAFLTKILVTRLKEIFSTFQTKEKVVAREIWVGMKKNFVKKSFSYQKIEPK